MKNYTEFINESLNKQEFKNFINSKLKNDRLYKESTFKSCSDFKKLAKYEIEDFGNFDLKLDLKITLKCHKSQKPYNELIDLPHDLEKIVSDYLKQYNLNIEDRITQSDNWLKDFIWYSKDKSKRFRLSEINNKNSDEIEDFGTFEYYVTYYLNKN
jgi:hypothetical protein